MIIRTETLNQPWFSKQPTNVLKPKSRLCNSLKGRIKNALRTQSTKRKSQAPLRESRIPRLLVLSHSIQTTHNNYYFPPNVPRKGDLGRSKLLSPRDQSSLPPFFFIVSSLPPNTHDNDHAIRQPKLIMLATPKPPFISLITRLYFRTD